MSKQKKCLKPALRFPEFQDQTSWIRFKLIDVADKNVKWSFIGGPFGSNLKSSDYIEQGVRIIQLQNIGDGQFNDDYKVFTSKEKADELLANNIYSGDIILSKMGDPVGRACIIPETDRRYVMCSDGIRLVVDEERHSKYFIYSLINGSQFRSVVESTATGSTRKRIGLAELKKLPIFLPVKQEQQKIADCLSSMDDLIAKSIKKLESLKSHKKGLMQKLFPEEGENKPDFRFPEFSMEANWKKEKLHKVVDLLSGYAFKSEYFSTTGKKMVTPKNFTKNGFSSFSEDNTKYTSEEFNERYICREGDLLLLLTDLTPSCELLGRPMLLTSSDGEVLLNQRIAKVIINGNINKNFLKYFFLSNGFRKRIINTATGSTVRHTSNKIVLSTELLLPNLSEQNKIAACLLSIDGLIRAQADKIETLKEYKKGLMQQLFPEMKESIA
ncbi:restriction endonuclease subunit S [Vibrio vulnificus]|nr:restriction endonuclease subunit S [Vibrio vulnificus]ELX4140203.1 restriction endonuclease subunit S [Vibrio vulnificus]